MFKKILCIQIISLLVCSCSSLPLTEKAYVSSNLVKLSREEKETIKLSEILFKNLNKNWIQNKKFKNEQMSSQFKVHLARDGSIESFRLCNCFCVDNVNNECETFVINTKKTIIKSFPIKELLSINYSNWEYIWLDFGSKEANELFAKQQKNNKN